MRVEERGRRPSRKPPVPPPPPLPSSTPPPSQAVVGAGAAGLVAARELLRAGHAPVVVYEASARVGGVWAYEEPAGDGDGGGAAASASDRLLSAGDHHSSLYPHLRTNLPRELMSYSDFPFCQAARPARHRTADDRTYPGWADVLAYLEAFADASPGVRDALRLSTRVLAVHRLPPAPDRGVDWPRWRVTAQAAGDAAPSTAEFDALVVANGHYRVPRVPDDVTISPSFEGCVLHAHSYRGPDAGPLAAALAAAPGGAAGAAVVVVGAAASGEDIGRELAQACGSVFLCARSWEAGFVKPKGRGNIRYAPPLAAVDAAGVATFDDGTTSPSPVATVVFCTGYAYTFEFFGGGEAAAAVTVRDNQVCDGDGAPLYEHAFPPSTAPGLSFLGLPYKVVPFPLCEAQARRLARGLSGEAPFPTRAEMTAAAQAEDAARAAAGTARRHAHRMGSPHQFDYCDALTLAAFGGDAAAAAPFMLPGWRRALYDAASAVRRADGDGYRDAGGLGEAAAEGDAWAAAWVAAREGG